MAPFPWVELDESREKYTYDIHPFSTFRSDKRKEKKKAQQQMQQKPRRLSCYLRVSHKKVSHL